MTEATAQALADSEEQLPAEPASASKPATPKGDDSKADGGDGTGSVNLLSELTRMWAMLADKPLVLAAIAAVIAVGLVLLISGGNSESDKVLYFGLSERDAGEIVEHLEKANIPYRLDSTGNIRVAESAVYNARLKVASAGLPRGTGQGLEFLDAPPEIGRSQFAEQARYHHALERELAKSIASLGSIDKARVHLARPKKSVFVRERSKPSASVVVHLYPGRSLDQGQVSAITHMISSSVPDLTNDRVTVVDQRGELISRLNSDSNISKGFERMDYTRRVEAHFIQRIEQLLAPMVGEDQVRAQVVAEVDFTRHEITSETFDPTTAAVRSEQLSEDFNGSKAATGIPGAMSNEPPSPAQLTAENALAEGAEGEEGAAVGKGRTKLRSVRNFELSRTVTHETGATGDIRRLSVAVVIGAKPRTRPVGGADSEGSTEETAATAAINSYSEEQLQRLTELVKNAVGFQEARGDSVQLINAEFAAEPAPIELPLWQQEGFQNLVKLGIAVAIGIFLIVTVVLPLLRNSVPGRDSANALPSPEREGAVDSEGNPIAADGSPEALDQSGQSFLLGGSDKMIDQGAISALFPDGLPENGDYETYVAAAQYAAAEDPVRTAQVLKRWIQDHV